MGLSDQSVHENVGRIILHVLISSHHTGWCFLKAQMRHDTHALAQTMHIHATYVRITHDDRSSKSRRADPLERPDRPERGPMHPLRRVRHGTCRRRGPWHQQWPQRHDSDRLAAAIDLCVDPCGWRRRRSSSARTAAEEPRKRSWDLPGMWGNALRQWEGRQRRKAGCSAQIQGGSWRRGIRAQGAIMGRGEAPRRPTNLESRRKSVRGRHDHGQVERRRREHLRGKARVRKGCSRALTEWVMSREQNQQ